MPDQPTLLPGSWIADSIYEPRRAPADPVALPYARDSDTSEEASRRALPRAGRDARRILDLIRAHGGLTCREIQELTGIPHETASARCTGLKDKGWIRDSGKRRPSAKGNPMTVWEAVP